MGKIITDLIHYHLNTTAILKDAQALCELHTQGAQVVEKTVTFEEDVKQIRILLADPEMTVGAVAKRFNVSRMTIYRYTTKS
ncbi:helix-turn-helix domain-containing protein [Escherichia coli]